MFNCILSKIFFNIVTITKSKFNNFNLIILGIDCLFNVSNINISNTTLNSSKLLHSNKKTNNIQILNSSFINLALINSSISKIENGNIELKFCKFLSIIAKNNSFIFSVFLNSNFKLINSSFYNIFSQFQIFLFQKNYNILFENCFFKNINAIIFLTISNCYSFNFLKTNLIENQIHNFIFKQESLVFSRFHNISCSKHNLNSQAQNIFANIKNSKTVEFFSLSISNSNFLSNVLISENLIFLKDSLLKISESLLLRVNNSCRNYFRPNIFNIQQILNVKIIKFDLISCIISNIGQILMVYSPFSVMELSKSNINNFKTENYYQSVGFLIVKYMNITNLNISNIIKKMILISTTIFTLETYHSFCTSIRYFKNFINALILVFYENTFYHNFPINRKYFLNNFDIFENYFMVTFSVLNIKNSNFTLINSIFFKNLLNFGIFGLSNKIFCENSKQEIILEFKGITSVNDIGLTTSFLTIERKICSTKSILNNVVISSNSFLTKEIIGDICFLSNINRIFKKNDKIFVEFKNFLISKSKISNYIVNVIGVYEVSISNWTISENSNEYGGIFQIKNCKLKFSDVKILNNKLVKLGDGINFIEISLRNLIINNVTFELNAFLLENFKIIDMIDCYFTNFGLGKGRFGYILQGINGILNIINTKIDNILLGNIFYCQNMRIILKNCLLKKFFNFGFYFKNSLLDFNNFKIENYISKEIYGVYLFKLTNNSKLNASFIIINQIDCRFCQSFIIFENSISTFKNSAFSNFKFTINDFSIIDIFTTKMHMANCNFQNVSIGILLIKSNSTINFY